MGSLSIPNKILRSIFVCFNSSFVCFFVNTSGQHLAHVGRYISMIFPLYFAYISIIIPWYFHYIITNCDVTQVPLSVCGHSSSQHLPPHLGRFPLWRLKGELYYQYLSKCQNIFVQISNHIFPMCKMYLSKPVYPFHLVIYMRSLEGARGSA